MNLQCTLLVIGDLDKLCVNMIIFIIKLVCLNSSIKNWSARNLTYLIPYKKYDTPASGSRGPWFKFQLAAGWEESFSLFCCWVVISWLPFTYKLISWTNSSCLAFSIRLNKLIARHKSKQLLVKLIGVNKGRRVTFEILLSGLNCPQKSWWDP